MSITKSKQRFTKETPLESALTDDFYGTLSEEGERILNLPAEEIKRELLKGHYGEEKNPLPPKAQMIAYGLAKGATTKEISDLTGLARNTVKSWMKDTRVINCTRMIQHISGIPNLTDEFKKLTPRALEVMHELMNDETCPAGTRLDAANKIIERIYGKPKERVAHEGNLLQGLYEKLDKKEENEEEALFELLTTDSAGDEDIIN